MPQPQTDPHATPLPPAVQKNVDKANNLADEFAAAVQPAPTEAEVAAAAEEAAAADAAVAEAAAEEAAAAEAAAATAAAADTPPKKQREDWKQKYSALQGKYDAEVPRMHRANEELAAQLEGLRGVVAAMQSTAAPAAPEPQAKFDPASVLSEAEVEDYGEDLVNMIGRVTQSVTAPLEAQLNSLREQNAELNQNLNGVSSRVVRDAQQDMHDKLDAAVEDWRVINRDEGFLRWLEQIDPLFGTTRQVALRDAYNNTDADRVIRFFKLFTEEHATPTTPASEPAPAANGKVPLETLAAPGRGRPGAGGGAPDEEKRIIPRAEVSAFYLDIQKGLYAGRDDDRLKKEAEIFAAAAEGRVR